MDLLPVGSGSTSSATTPASGLALTVLITSDAGLVISLMPVDPATGIVHRAAAHSGRELDRPTNHREMKMTTYYDGPDLEARVLAALRSAGRDVEAIDSDDLAGLDEFHALGRAGTLALAELADIVPGERVLDVGAGIGGPARALARHFDVHVTAVDPTARFARLAGTLTARSGLSERVTVVHADGRRLPFPDASFDVAWTQAVWQSVEDKDALAGEIRRVLAPSGRVAMFELIGDGRDLYFPVPWGDGSADSFVPTEASLQSVLEHAGFRAVHWVTGEEAQAALASAAGDTDRMTSGLPGVGLDLLMPDYFERMAGLARNVEDGRIGVVLAVLSATDDLNRGTR